MRGAFVQYGAGRRFSFKRARQQVEVGNAFRFETRHSQGYAFEPGVAVEGADGLEWRAAVENRYRL